MSAAVVKELRERTGLGRLECKKALTEAGGDIDAAIEALRKSSGMKAAKKAGRTAADGVERHRWFAPHTGQATFWCHPCHRQGALWRPSAERGSGCSQAEVSSGDRQLKEVEWQWPPCLRRLAGVVAVAADQDAFSEAMLDPDAYGTTGLIGLEKHRPIVSGAFHNVHWLPALLLFQTAQGRQGRSGGRGHDADGEPGGR